ncbi:MAG: tRNA uridine-5-carboxymethylaminomethyl(34) synthesis GTPase MnmE [Armatimonadota bacterium]|nr:tRNA uridine-5-carboxymethylaminomethyl(34) synthesis GTPase MnmE [Armatimonadota bacterium]
MDFEDTIVAPITGSARAAIAVVRLSGSEAHNIARNLCPDTGSELRHAYYTAILSLDDGICTLFAAGASYTGENVAEIACHGSPEIVRNVVEAALVEGARYARAGEFTERAFLNGRLDLTQAEAVRETVEASTDAQARRASLLREGALFKKIGTVEDLLGRAIASIEAVVDFSDEVGALDRATVLEYLQQAEVEIEALLNGVPASRLIREGLRIALVGRPNVGKSSLMNALLGADRAIVTDVPGTTRDTIEESASIGGYPVVLTDTAGLRDAEDAVERLGVERSRKAIEQADSVWLIFEAPLGITDEDRLLAAGIDRDVTWIANKTDLGSFGGDALAASAREVGGTRHLAAWVIERFAAADDVPLANDRHEPELKAALESLAQARQTLAADSIPVDLACVDLYAALDRLGRITGRTAPDEIIQRVFAEFCIGK